MSTNISTIHTETIGSAAPRDAAGLPWQWLRGRPWLAAVALVILVGASYAPIVRDDFIWDDDAYVTHNGTLRTLPGLWAIWFVPFSIPQYYPLVHTTFWIEYHLWGLAPLGYHVVNVLLHSTSAVLFWRLLVQLRLPGAWLAAALFAVHPIDVESVAWVTERKNVLSLVFALAALLSYLRFHPASVRSIPEDVAGQSGGARWYVLALVLFIAALLSKTVVATVPAVLLVIFWWRTGRFAWKELPLLLPFFVLGAASGVFTALLEVIHVGATGDEWDFTWIERVLIAGRSLWFYASKLAWPYQLIFFYRRWTIDAREAWQFIYPAAAVATIGLLWFGRARVSRGPLAATLIFAGVLTPALGFLNVYPFRYSFVADHFQYHASLALFALVGSCAALVIARLPAALHNLAGVVVGVVLLGLGALTARQTTVYENLEVLYRDTIARNPVGFIAHSNLAVYLDQIGRHDEAIELGRQAVQRNPQEPGIHNNVAAILLGKCTREGRDAALLDECFAELREALRVSPNYAPAHSNLARAYLEIGEPDKALEHISRALELNPHDAHTLYVKGAMLSALDRADEAEQYFREALSRNPDHVESLYALGIRLSDLGRVEEAMAHWRLALHFDPGCTDAHYALACALEDRGDAAGAAAHFRKAVDLRPGYLNALVKLGMSLIQLGDMSGAAQSFHDALAIDPTNADARLGLAMSLARLGKTDEAAAEFQGALEQDPTRAQAHFEFANLLASQDDLSRAITHYSEALRLEPEYFEALQNLGAATLKMGEVDRAIECFHKALKLQPNNPHARSNLDLAQKLKLGAPESAPAANEPRP